MGKLFPGSWLNPTQTLKSPKYLMKSTELHPDTNIHSGQSTTAIETVQEKLYKTLHIHTIKIGTYVNKRKNKHKRQGSLLPSQADSGKSIGSDNADTMNYMSSFVQGPTHFSLPEEKEVRDVSARIEFLTAHYKISYYQVAKEMGVSRVTVHALRKGGNATQKMMGKLEAAEKRLAASVVEPKTIPDQTLLLFAVNSQIPETVTKSDEIQVRRKGTDANPHPDPILVKLTTPPLTKGIAAIVQAQTKDRCNDLLKTCLPREYAHDQWIELMSPTSFLAAVKQTVMLILGPDWKEELPKLIEETDAQNKALVAHFAKRAAPATPDPLPDNEVFEMLEMPPRHH